MSYSWMSFLVFISTALFVSPTCVGSLAAQTKQPPGPAILKAINPIVSQFEDGGSLPGGQKVVPGETVYFRFAAQGFRTSETGKVQLSGHAQAFDSEDTPLIPRDEVMVATTLRDEDKNWKPVLRFEFQLPAIARPGTYRIRFEVTDEQTHKSASSETSFEVAGRDVPKSAVLVIRGVTFYRTPDDETPLRVAAYKAGDMVWMRFDVTGYKYGEQNAVDVTYDVAVTSSDGKPLFSQEDAAVERSQAFYPQPWVPGSFSLTLQPTIAQGEYNVEITARDGVGKQTAKATAAFQIR